MKSEKLAGRRMLNVGMGLLLLSIASCKILVETPEKHVVLDARYQKMDVAVLLNDSAKAPVVVTVRSDFVPDTVAKKKTILNFSDQGQKALINAYNGRAHADDDAFKGFLGSNYFADNDKSNVVDFTTRTISITISVQNQDFFGVANVDSTFADRLEKIRFKLVLDQAEDFKFKSWNKMATQYGKFYADSRSYTGSITPTLSPALTIGTVTASAGSLASTRQYAEADTVYEQYVSSNGILFDDNFVIEQDGTPKTTLMGNTILQVTLKAKHVDSKHAIALDKLYDSSMPNTGDKVKLTKKTVLFPIFTGTKTNVHDRISGTLSFEYLLRHVVSGVRTFAESDDQIQYQYGTIKGQKVNLLGKDDMGIKLFKVIVDGQYITLKNTQIHDPSEAYSAAAFLTNDEALAFLNWLQSQPNGDGIIGLAGPYQVGGIDNNGHFGTFSPNYLHAHKLSIIEE